jgi:hypothetical protein
MKLPPTPDMTDGHEAESDPETENIKRRSNPGSGSGSFVDLTGTGKKDYGPPPRRIASGTTTPLATSSSGLTPTPNVPANAPRLPPRSASRPVLPERRSSTSHYSDAGTEQFEDQRLFDDASGTAPPVYEERGAGYPPEKGGPHGDLGVAGLSLIPTSGEAAGGSGLAGAEGQTGEEVMSESEKKEWEQFLAEHHGREEQGPPSGAVARAEGHVQGQVQQGQYQL